MDARAKGVLNEILSDLNRISQEMDSVSSDLRVYKGIGTQDCANKLNGISTKYKNAKYQLSKIK